MFYFHYTQDKQVRHEIGSIRVFREDIEKLHNNHDENNNCNLYVPHTEIHRFAVKTSLAVSSIEFCQCKFDESYINVNNG